MTTPPAPPASLAGKVFAITGASGGLGLATAQELVRCGARVALLARSQARIEVEALALGDNALAVACDVADEQSVEAAFAAVAARFGLLHGLVNNAAQGRPTDLADFTAAEFLGQLAVNVLGPALCTKAALPLMARAGFGEVINVSSISVDDPFPMLTPYAASKAALEAYTIGAQRELAERGVRVQVLRVGGMSGGQFASSWTPEKSAKARAMAERQGRFLNRGAPMPPELAARTIVDMLTTPRPGHAALVVLKPMLGA